MCFGQVISGSLGPGRKMDGKIKSEGRKMLGSPYNGDPLCLSNRGKGASALASPHCCFLKGASTQVSGQPKEALCLSLCVLGGAAQRGTVLIFVTGCVTVNSVDLIMTQVGLQV